MDYQKQINNWFSNWEHRFEVGVPNIVAETASEFFKERFRTQEWDKKPWQPLSPKYAAQKTRGKGRILTRTGALMASIRPSEVRADRIVISAGNSKVPYARIHNEGLQVKGVATIKGYTNRNFMGKGKKVKIKPHTRNYTINMPQRQFMGHSRYLNKLLRDRLIKAFN
ncbi:phage virion morphogenesis protein [Zunongwangia sp. SCSIO 43204]|uniref:phage virion morphogenesis protein n=1 Tax=Zunongwangia sp. SCSIO 43204 TaxID=2779359 RepID=UPI001CA886B2|nr:phage virion morphogenesis protein [Zunongwangia sp. SCSIO 43204]UAB84987.1 phage virion morphogenesis protein [Zunongwangia sp. SCSIO 43204]